MKKLIFCLLLLNLFSYAPPLHAQYKEDVCSKIDSLFQEVHRTDRPGCALVIVRDGEIFYKKGYGMADLERSIAIQPSTVFYAGSISKQFVTSCALLLSEKGKLDLNAPVQQYLPDFPDYGFRITIQHLIYHISGIKDYFEIFEKENIDYLNRIHRDTVYALIKSQDSLDFPPGKKYSYSNSGYLMLSKIIEQVSGMSLSEFADREIFKPLGMNHSLFLDNNHRLIPNRAWGYHLNVMGEVENMLMRFDLAGSGGLYTTAEDLFLWDQNFFNPRIGGPQFLDKLLTTGITNDGRSTKYAFALQVDELLGKKVIGHSGSLGGYRAQYMQFPEEKTSIIILSNLANFKPGEKAHEIAKILFGE